ncbi:hypothetical protein F5X68DRAFT_262452 [Plectosphaerella plurivora]|uniref:Zn(2)-C6 fungal-type domain-containing protein n=1 Tax=Plectosphaerella plurivora TaxID=936078 RepID=A0A9P9AB04_9PEZI|nr:hypothetical protein F5X68DRAFT_262452 [Plectosphaerella plurivora]
MSTSILSGPEQLEAHEQPSALAAHSTEAPDPAPKAGTKRRAARACLSCRSRKVRCNVVEQSPCTNCRFDGVECSVETGRKKRRSIKFREHIEGSGLAIKPALSKKDEPLQSVLPGVVDTEAHGSLDDDTFSFLRPWSTIDDVTPIMKYLYTAENEPSNPQQPSTLASVDSFEDYSSDSMGSQAESPSHSTSTDGIVLSCIVRPLLTRISLEDAMYLSLKGALDVPEGPFCDALLEAFINYVHPFLPILDLAEFLQLMQQHQDELALGKNDFGQDQSPASLLLVQAVMFAASAFVDSQYLQEAGYTSRRAARKSFFEKTKLLYTLDCETDPMAISQALLLMAFWHETLDDEKGASHWIGVAMDIANTVHTASLTPAKKRLWKRIRWTCLVRDRLVSLGMRLPLKIDSTGFKDTALTMEDFDIVESSEITGLPFARNSVLQDPVRQRGLAALFMAESQLCVHIGRILTDEYEVRSRELLPDPHGISRSRMLLYPKATRDQAVIDNLDGELRLWEESLPDVCKYWSPTIPPSLDNPRSSVLLHQIILNLVYHAAIATLHRPNANSGDPSDARSSRLSKLRVSHAARGITHMATDLYRLRLDSYLPSAAVTVLIPAILTLIVEWRASNDERAKRETMRNIFYCRRVLERLRDVYSGGDHGAELVRAALGCEPEDLEREAKVEEDEGMGISGEKMDVGDEDFGDLFTFDDFMEAEGDDMAVDGMFTEAMPFGIVEESLAVAP